MSLSKAKKSKVDRTPNTIDLYWEFKSRIVQTRLGNQLTKISIWLCTMTINVASGTKLRGKAVMSGTADLG